MGLIPVAAHHYQGRLQRTNRLRPSFPPSTSPTVRAQDVIALPPFAGLSIDPENLFIHLEPTRALEGRELGLGVECNVPPSLRCSV